MHLSIYLSINATSVYVYGSTDMDLNTHT
uniref:Uncharacterized protein n=1 Tax=Anguilla anguilla TaxID=7936 RepID=A0A0E9QR17_ANGAN